LVSGVSWSTIAFNTGLSWIWIASWLSGALVHTTYKWGFFVFGTFAYFLLAASLFVTGTVTAKRVGVAKHYFALGGWLVFLWLLYPIAWGLDDGGNEIRVTSGFIFFGILDVLMVPILAFAFLALATKWDFR
jgi:bacteriorhodopsin